MSYLYRQKIDSTIDRIWSTGWLALAKSQSRMSVYKDVGDCSEREEVCAYCVNPSHLLLLPTLFQIFSRMDLNNSSCPMIVMVSKMKTLARVYLIHLSTVRGE